MASIRSLALVGAVGGAGTTRTAVECAAALARDGREVAVLDAAYATQGLGEFVRGRIDPDLTGLCLDPERSLDEGLYDLDASVEGRIALAPASAPFERLARASDDAAAQALADRVAEAVARFDHVLVDVPPIAANPSIAAVHAVDRVAIVAPDTEHGADGRRRQRDVLRDVDAPDGDPAVIAVAVPGSGDRTDGSGDDGNGSGGTDADATVPRGPVEFAAAPACLGTDAFAAGVVAATETLFETELDVEFGETGVIGRLSAGVDRVRGGR
ncbi:ParA family protein [Halobaculum sp. WSA2]|uniref:ParA family protein n=1 Tax=Halobaculum saliterrae TaxID=2073113 RepID=A0A6B0SS34_9EURY|nr:ParA family protein [Halobaculum saliterrae]MXR41748.1 ParA family protein [Halobaculum saliterrae]